jgi:hypothetical protein
MTETPETEPQIVDEAAHDAAVEALAHALGSSAPGKQSEEPVDPSITEVLDEVKERGFITTGEIFAAFPDLEPGADDLRDLWDMFESRGIKVLDEIAEELKLEDQRRGAQPPADTDATKQHRRAEHRPSATSRPGTATTTGARRSNTPYEEPDEELQAVRQAQRATHT